LSLFDEKRVDTFVLYICLHVHFCPRPPGRKSVTSDLFHQWLSSTPRSPGASGSGVTFSANPPTVFSATDDNDASNDDNPAAKSLEVLDPNDRLIDLILDISNELDINVLCHKILLNVGHLTQVSALRFSEKF
jgi:hypothetical protein